MKQILIPESELVDLLLGLYPQPRYVKIKLIAALVELHNT